MKKAKVTATIATIGMIFDFSMSNMGMAHIRALVGIAYFTKGGTRSPGPEFVHKPQDDQVMVFEDLFTMEFCMLSHPVLIDIL
jgi:hypothetical protein